MKSLEEVFYGASLFNQDISLWDVSRVKNMKKTFFQALTFNQDISPWNMSSVVDMQEMFAGAKRFNQSLCQWGKILPPTAEAALAFKNTSCPIDADPDLAAKPPGPFCQPCTCFMFFC